MYKKLRVLTSAVLLLIFGAAQFFGFLPTIDNAIHDNIMVSSREVSENIVIVAIDDRSINEIGRWPWPRDIMAYTIESLYEMGAAVIGINVYYDVYGILPEYDQRLVSASAQAEGRVVLAAQGIFSGFRDTCGLHRLDDFIIPFDGLAAVTSFGFTNMDADSDGVMRQALTALRFGDITVHSFPFEVYRAYRENRGQTVDPSFIPLDASGQFPIHYAGGSRSFANRSLVGVLNGEYPAWHFENKIVLIGPFSPGIGGQAFPTPVQTGSPTYGIEVAANIVQNMLEGEFKEAAPWWLNLAIMVFAGLIVLVFFHRLKPIHALVLTLGLVAVQLMGARLVYDFSFLIIRPGHVILFLVFCWLANLMLGILAAQKEKQHIQGLFGRFVAPDVVKQIIDSGGELKLGGSVKEITVVFVDIRGFTAFSEANPPEKVVAMVNRYLGLTSRCVQENSGTIDKYIGDATMALFNAPNDLPDHALCAVKAAWAMKEGSVALREEILREYNVDLQFGVGVNTGPAVIGNMGSEFRMDYTAIGDTVNTAARLEANSQKGQIIISDSTYQLVKDHVEVTDRGLLNVKNKKQGIQIYNLEGMK